MTPHRITLNIYISPGKTERFSFISADPGQVSNHQKKVGIRKKIGDTEYIHVVSVEPVSQVELDATSKKLRMRALERLVTHLEDRYKREQEYARWVLRKWNDAFDVTCSTADEIYMAKNEMAFLRMGS